MKTRTITYTLRVNRMQYRYLRHAIQTMRQIYLYFCRIIQRNAENAQKVLSEDQLSAMVFHYFKAYHDDVAKAEQIAMLHQLICYQNRCLQEPATSLPTYYRCGGIRKTEFRGLHLERMMPLLSWYQREPLLKHWEILDGHIRYHHKLVLLTLRFRKEKE